MADITDDADAATDLFLRSALSKRQPDAPEATGRCLNCEAEVPEGRKFCDADCRDDFVARNRRR